MQPEDLQDIGKELQKNNPNKNLKKLGKELQDYDHSFFMVFDSVKPGKERSIKDIGVFVKERKSGFNYHELRKEVLIYIPVVNAMNEWLSTIDNPHTREKYRQTMERIFKLKPLNEIIEKNYAITSLCKNWAGAVGVYKVIEELDTSKPVIKVCQRTYSRFCDFIRIATLGIVDPEESPKQKEDYYAASIIYKDIDWKKFISSMRTPFDILAEMTFLAAKSCEFRLRLVNSRKNALTLDSSQINFQNNTICFRADQSYHVTDILGSPLCIRFPDEFMKKLKKYLGEREGVVFLSKKNKPLFSIQVQREFKRVSKALPDEITPVMLGWAGVLAYKEESVKNSV